MEAETFAGNNGWTRVSNIMKSSHPFFQRLFYWEGFDLSSNIYLFQTSEGVALIDPGNDYTAFYDLFSGNSLNISPSDIKHVLLSHGHSEHALGLFELLRSYPSLRTREHGLTVYLHENAPGALKNLADQLGCNLVFVKDGQEIALGEFAMKVVYTPGHTMDSVCYWHEETGSLFSGDTVLPFAVASPDPVGGGRVDYHLFSMRILRKLGVSHLFPGHGEIIKNEAPKVLEGNYAGLIKKVIGLQCPWIEGAQLLLRKGYLDETVFCCDKVLENDPSNRMALYLKACCLNDMGRFDEALNTFQKIDERGVSDNPLYFMGYGCSLMGMGRYEESLKYFDKALQLAPGLENALVYKGLALYLMGKIDKALDIKAFEKAFTGKLKEELLKTYGGQDQEKDG